MISPRHQLGLGQALCAVMLALALLHATPCAAVIDCTSSPTTLNNGQDPSDDFVTTSHSTSTPCIIITGNGVSDFGGHKVTCTNTDYCGTAIEFRTLTGASTVRGADIQGPFNIGISGHPATTTERTVADSNRISTDAAAYQAGIFDVDKITGNVVIYGSGQNLAGILWTPNDDLSTGVTSQVVEDNMIDCKSCVPISVQSSVSTSTAPKVRRNLLRGPVDYPLMTSVGGTDKFSIENNVFVWDGTTASSTAAFTLGGATTYTGNICDQDVTAADDEGVCSGPPTPFDLP